MTMRCFEEPTTRGTRALLAALGAALALLSAGGCGGTEEPPDDGIEVPDGGPGGCRCQGSVPGGYLDVACGESACLSGRGYRCTAPDTATPDPAACGGGPPPAPRCDASNCDGCCSGTSCLGGESATACGYGGAACVDCGPGRVCSGGVCQVDPASRWSVILLDARIPERKASGDPWDGAGGAPDVYARVRAGSPSAPARRSSTDSDTIFPRWNEVVLSSVRADALMAYLGFQFWDEDALADDAVASCAFGLLEGAFDEAPIEESCQRITFRFRLRRE